MQYRNPISATNNKVLDEIKLLRLTIERNHNDLQIKSREMLQVLATSQKGYKDIGHWK